MYLKWTDGAIKREGVSNLGAFRSLKPGDHDGGKDQDILALASNFPLAIPPTILKASTSARKDYHNQMLLIHPSTIHPDGSLTVFKNLDEGTSLTCLHTPDKVFVSSIRPLVNGIVSSSRMRPKYERQQYKEEIKILEKWGMQVQEHSMLERTKVCFFQILTFSPS